MAVTIVPDEDTPATIVPDEEPAQSWGDSLHNLREGMDASVQGVVRGIPIVGPLLSKGVNAAVAAPAAVTGNFPGAYKSLEDTSGRIAEEHPYASTAGEVTGGVMSTVPAARAFPLVFGGSKMPGQILSGGAIGGTDAMIRSGGDPKQAALGAGIGAAGPVMGSVLAPAGQLASSGARWAVDKLPDAINPIAKKIVPMESGRILDAADTGYNSLGKSMVYQPQDIGSLVNNIKNELYTNHGRSAQLGAAGAHGVLDALGTLPPTPGALHTARKALYGVTGSPDETHSARLAASKIDDFLGRKPPGVAPGYTPPGSVATTSPYDTLARANADWRAGQNAKAWEARQAVAHDVAKQRSYIPMLSEAPELRKQALSMLNNKQQGRFLQPEDQAALRQASAPASIGEGVLNAYGAMSGTRSPSLGSLVNFLPWGSGLTSPLTNAAITAGGIGSNVAASGLARQAANKVGSVMRSASPSAQADMLMQLPPRTSMTPAPSPTYNSLTDRGYRDEIARLLAGQTERSMTEPRRVIIDTTNLEQQ